MPGEKVRVRREEIAKAIEDSVQQKRSFLDLETGDVVSVFLDMVERGQDQTAKRIAARRDANTPESLLLYQL